MKIVAMIPARLGSQRIKNKNIRYLNDKLLVEYIINAAKQSKYIDEIYLNSESNLLKKIAQKHDIKFYERQSQYSSNEATNDDFAYDFLKNIECSILIQLLPTSPFIKSSTIDNFIEKIKNENLDTLISVSNIKIESIYRNKPINFNDLEKTPPSQLLEPVRAYACGIMGWRKNNFLQNIKKFNAAYHGGEGKKDYFVIRGIETIDIDNEDDFKIAEFVSKSTNSKNEEPRYYTNEEDLIFDRDRERVLIDDGVKINNMNDYNKEITSVDNIIKMNPKDKSWSHTLVNSKSNSATLIAQMPGEGNRMHYHNNWDEWWYIIKGEWEWILDGRKLSIKKGDHVFIERNKIHKIKSIGKDLSIRLAVSRSDVDHIYTHDDYK
tara:strand:- start:559 stop:1695 length:1137 start_codon:yes stop_codon:yes gene_type:complete